MVLVVAFISPTKTFQNDIMNDIMNEITKKMK